MKGSNYISPLMWLLMIISGVLIGGCESDSKPVEKIYKADSPKSATKNEVINTFTKKVPKLPKDSVKNDINEFIVPPDSNTKDTTETLHRIEKKTETKPYKRLYLYNIYKRSPIS